MPFSYYPLFFGGLYGREAVPEERRAQARERLLRLAGSGGLDDQEARMLAEKAVRRARDEAPERDEELPALSPEEVRARFGVTGPDGGLPS